jgi:hypothetical protein
MQACIVQTTLSKCRQLELMATYQLDTKRMHGTAKEVSVRRQRLRADMESHWSVWCEWHAAAVDIVSRAVGAEMQVRGDRQGVTRAQVENAVHAELGTVSLWVKLVPGVECVRSGVNLPFFASKAAILV